MIELKDGFKEDIFKHLKNKDDVSVNFQVLNFFKT